MRAVSAPSSAYMPFFAFIPALILPAFRALRRREVLRPFRTLFIRADLFAGLAGSLSIGVVSLVPWLWLPVFFDHALLRLTRRAVGPRFLQRDNYYFFIQSLSLQHGAAIPWRDTSHYLHPHPSPLSISLVGILDRCPSESTRDRDLVLFGSNNSAVAHARAKSR